MKSGGSHVSTSCYLYPGLLYRERERDIFLLVDEPIVCPDELSGLYVLDQLHPLRAVAQNAYYRDRRVERHINHLASLLPTIVFKGTIL